MNSIRASAISTASADLHADTSPDRNTWNAESYAANGRFVADLAGEAVRLLAPIPGERILDVGCGDGALTLQLQSLGAVVLGLDQSPDMVRAARARGLDVKEENVAHLTAEAQRSLDQQFDAVFSNAALHWIPLEHQPDALRAIFGALRPGGRFVAEMGGFGNIAAIRTALKAVLAPFGIDSEAAAASVFPSPSQYSRLLRSAGFEVEDIALVPRPTSLRSAGMKAWLTTFRNGVFERLDSDTRDEALAATVELLRPVLCDDEGHWTADYVRLRFRAVKPHVSSIHP